jgi:hypothetical protein
MLVVIALGADGAELLLKFLGTHDLGHGLILTSPDALRGTSSNPPRSIPV